MTPPRVLNSPLSALGAALLLSVLALAPRAHAADDDEDKSGVLTVWSVTAGGQVIGSERLRVVHAETGSFFASGDLKIKVDKTKTELQSHVQRDADGTVAKYRRVEARRKGKGLFLFKREGGARIVGVNTDDKPADYTGMLSQHIWDPLLWHDLALLPAQFKGDGPVSLSYFDVEARKSGKATFTRGPATQVTDAKGGLVAVAVWQITGAPGSARALYVDAKQRLVGVKGLDREMLLKGWTWDDGTKAAATGDDDDKKPAGGDDDDSNGEAGVGP